MIKEQMNKNGYKYKLLVSSDRIHNKQVCIYEQIDQHQNHKVVAHEVQVLRYAIATKHTKKYEEGTEYIIYPSNNDWGKYGWTYIDNLNEATAKYNDTVTKLSFKGRL